jgi:hypothetical protein
MTALAYAAQSMSHGVMVTPPTILSHSFLRKGTSGVGYINLPLPSGTIAGDKMPFMQLREGTALPTEYGGSTSLIESQVNYSGTSYDMNVRIAWIEVSSGMVSDGYIALHVGDYGSALALRLSSQSVTFHPPSGTPSNAANWSSGPDDLSTGYTTINSTAFNAGDLVIHPVAARAYGSIAVGAPWTVYLDGGVPTNIGAPVKGNPAVFTQTLSSTGQATGASVYLTDGPTNSFTSHIFAVRAA